jgi:hypothetical protein
MDHSKFLKELKTMPTKWIYQESTVLVKLLIFLLSLFDVDNDSRSNSFKEKKDDAI